MHRVLAALLGLFIGLSAMPAKSETIGYAEGVRQLMAACGQDIDKYCSTVRLGGNRIQACLAQNGSNVSQQCVATFNQVYASLAARAAAQAEVPKVCAGDAKRLCSNFRAGNARILRCLIRSENVRSVSNKCNEAITNAGWR